MGIRDWLFKQLSGRAQTAAAPALSTAKSTVQYFEVPVTAADKFLGFLCSDNECPCPGTEPLVPSETGFLFISSGVVEMRKDARSQAEIEVKLERIRKNLEKNLDGANSKSLIIWGAGTTRPIFLCRQGAERRGLDLATAAQDAKMWLETGRCPLRPTPKV
jgi:hypothetical protein